MDGRSLYIVSIQLHPAELTKKSLRLPAVLYLEETYTRTCKFIGSPQACEWTDRAAGVSTHVSGANGYRFASGSTDAEALVFAASELAKRTNSPDAAVLFAAISKLAPSLQDWADAAHASETDESRTLAMRRIEAVLAPHCASIGLRTETYLRTESVLVVRSDERDRWAEDRRTLWGVSFHGREDEAALEASVSGSGKPVARDILAAFDQFKARVELMRKLHTTQANHSLPLVLSPSAAGTFFHEVVGHSLEVDDYRDVDWRLPVGERLPLAITAYDDATAKGMFGSRRMDDDGRPSRRIKLIDEGNVVSCLDITSVPCARRSSYRLPPLARMSHLCVSVSARDAFHPLLQLPHIFIPQFATASVSTDGTVELLAIDPLLVTRTGVEAKVPQIRVAGHPKDLLAQLTSAASRPEISGSLCSRLGANVPTSTSCPSIVLTEG